ALWDYGKGCLALVKFVLAHKAFTMMEQTASAIRNTAPWLSPLYYRGIAYDQLADLAERQGILPKRRNYIFLPTPSPKSFAILIPKRTTVTLRSRISGLAISPLRWAIWQRLKTIMSKPIRYRWQLSR
ncbi:MAG: hypothetical protein IJW46_06605, partial [Clostridia bacterium]|nr:hypothetical protein [Clostridia bacterium]